MVIIFKRLGTGEMETTKRYYRIDRTEIAFLRFIFEAYDGIAVVRTMDAQKGIILLYIPPGCEDDVEYVLQDLAKQIMIEPIFLQSSVAETLQLNEKQEDF